MFEKGSSFHKGALEFAHGVLGDSEVRQLKRLRAVLGIATVDVRGGILEEIKKGQEELTREIELAQTRQGFWGRLQDTISEEHYIWHD